MENRDRVFLGQAGSKRGGRWELSQVLQFLFLNLPVRELPSPFPTGDPSRQKHEGLFPLVLCSLASLFRGFLMTTRNVRSGCMPSHLGAGPQAEGVPGFRIPLNFAGNNFICFDFASKSPLGSSLPKQSLSPYANRPLRRN